MGLFISDAMAATAPAATQTSDGAMFQVLMMIVIFVMFYLVLIRPQSKRAKEQKEMIGNLKKGDEIITSGGILARVVSVEEPYIRINPSEGIELVLQKNAVVSILPKGTLKSL